MEGLLGDLWQKVGGRDQLAAITGIRGSELSRYNSGKQRLGIRNAQRIADALDVTLAELGRPENGTAGRQEELEELRAVLAETLRRVDALEAELRDRRAPS